MSSNPKQKYTIKGAIIYTVEPLGVDTSLLATVSNVLTKFSSIFFKKTSIIRTLSNTENGH